MIHCYQQALCIP